MYEIRQKQRQELRKKKWFRYALLAIGIFLFCQGSSLLTKNFGYASTSVIIGIILHSASVGHLCQRIFKMNSSNLANAAMIFSLIIVAFISYSKSLYIILIFLLDLVSIFVYILVSFINFRSRKNRQE